MKLDDEKLKFAMKTWIGSGTQSDEKLKIENLPEVDKTSTESTKKSQIRV